MKLTRLLIIFAFAFCAFSIEAHTDTNKLQVEDISIEIKNPSKQKTIHLNTKKGCLFSQSCFDRDLKELSKHYYKVEPTVNIENGCINIKIAVWNRPIIDSVIFHGNECIPNSKLLNILDIKKKAEFNRDEFIKQFQSLKMFYMRKGFFESKLTYSICHKNDNENVDIVISIEEGKCGKIKELVINGLNGKEKRDVKEILLTRQYRILSSWLSGSGMFHPEMIEQDSLTITHMLQNKGFADASVKINVEESCKNGIKLTIDVEKGKLYRIGKIYVSGHQSFSADMISNNIKFASGSCYSQDIVWTSANNIKDFYGKKGFINAVVDTSFCFNESTQKFDIHFVISEGTPCKVGLIKIIGNKTTNQSVILNESLLAPGDCFNKIKLESTESRLRNTGYFKSVSAYTVRSQLDPGNVSEEYRDLYIEVAETTTGNVGLFMGFSSLDQLFGGLELSESNFRIAGIAELPLKGCCALRGSGEFMHLKMNIGSKVHEYTIKWTKPHILDTQWILGVETEKVINKALSPEYDVTTIGGNVSASYIINHSVKAGTYYRGNHSRLDKNYNSGLGPNVKDNHGFISAAGGNLVFDNTDHPRSPRNGLRARLNAEVAGFGGNYEFFKIGCFSSYYHAITRKSVFKMRFELQSIKPYGNTTDDKVPVSERFFLGGETSVRGFKSYILGPKYSPSEPKGGLTSLFISEEIQSPIVCRPLVNGFMFIDGGFLGGDAFKINKKLDGSAGFGVRFEAMQNMPIMLGLGWPFKPYEHLTYVNSHGVTVTEKFNRSQRFFFALGGLF